MATEVESRDVNANLSKTMKRSNKPLMERRRRCRINASLNQLKSLVLDALNKDTSQYSKLEKADILEMTVRHLRTLQRQQLAAAAVTDSSVVGKFQSGFSECAGEVSRYLSTVDGISPDIRVRLLDHLGKCVGRVLSATPQDVSTVQTQPLNVQIPYASQAASLPGAAFIATTNQQAVYTPRGAQYVGAFQVLPSSAFTHSDLATAYVMTSSQGGAQIRLVNSPTVYMGSSGGSTASSCSPSPQSSLGSRTPSPVSSEPRHSPVNLAIKSHVLVAHHAATRETTQESVWRPW